MVAETAVCCGGRGARMLAHIFLDPKTEICREQSPSDSPLPAKPKLIKVLQPPQRASAVGGLMIKHRSLWRAPDIQTTNSNRSNAR